MPISRQPQNHQTFTKFHLLLASLILSSLAFTILSIAPASATAAPANSSNVSNEASAAASTSSASANNIPSRATLSAAIDRVENFAEYQKYANLGTSGSGEKYYKEYAHLRSLVAEMTNVHTNYDTIATSTDSWKIAYLIDYSADALRGCEYLFGLKKQQTTASPASTPSDQSRAASSNQPSPVSSSQPSLAASNQSSPTSSNQPSATTSNQPSTATSSLAQPINNSFDANHTAAPSSSLATSSELVADPRTLPRSVRPLVRQLVQLCANVPAHPDQLDLPRRRALLIESV